MSNAVGIERVSKIVGYQIKKGDFREVSPNLPQRIAIIGEANTANQATLVTDPVVVTSAKQAGDLYGYGSPIYAIMRILRPLFGDGVGGIPTVVYAQEEAGGAAAKALTVTATGNATGNGTHTVVIGGRRGVDNVNYDINIVSGDTPIIIHQKIVDAVNNVLGAPVTAALTAAPGEATLTSKWAGLTSDGLIVTVDTNGNDLGVSYAVLSTVAGSGTPSIAAALTAFGNEWNTMVVNAYGTEAATLTALENFNGKPDPEQPTGRYVGTIMKPIIALTGSVADDPSSVTDTRETELTIAICPAPGSAGLAMEAAANMAVLFARQAQDAPHLDVSGKPYPDMPTPASIGSMANYNTRDTIVKKGCSTVDLVAGFYVVQDFVTTYHPAGENPPQFRYCRNLVIDFNVRYSYLLLEQIHVVDHVIAADLDTVTADKVIKPKEWKQLVSNQLANELAQRALIVQAAFMQDSITVDLSDVNPDRLETFFRYKRSGLTRIAATDAEAGFNFGTLN